MRISMILAITAALLVAGCASPEELDNDTNPGAGTMPTDPNPPQGIADGEPNPHGIDLDIRFTKDDHKDWAIEGTITHRGSQTVYIHDICVDSARDAMYYEGERMEHREPQATCMAFGLRAFEPGEVLVRNFTWDERVWKDGEAQDAAAGNYEWAIHFEYFLDQDGSERHEAVDAVGISLGTAAS